MEEERGEKDKTVVELLLLLVMVLQLVLQLVLLKVVRDAEKEEKGCV